MHHSSVFIYSLIPFTRYLWKHNAYFIKRNLVYVDISRRDVDVFTEGRVIRYILASRQQVKICQALRHKHLKMCPLVAYIILAEMKLAFLEFY